jgi:hypothetical protein
MSVDDSIRVQQIDVLTEGDGRGDARVYDFNLVVLGGLAAPYVRVQEQNLVAIGAQRAVIRVQAIDLVLIAAEGVIPQQALEINAFQYDIDGHIFYGIHIEDRGTFVYDQMTGQWTQWQSGSLLYWNAQFCLKWDGGYYAASLLDNMVVEINPNSILDDSFRDNDFIVTGRMESQSRKYVPNSEVQLFGSVGLRGGDVSLRYSDDDGVNFSSYVTVTVPPGERRTSVMWYDLGSVRSPGRVYQLLDTGTMRRVQTLNAKLGEGDE